MPFLHLDTGNDHKETWYELVKEHPAGFEILEWSPDQNRDLLYRSHPTIDLQLFPRTCISIFASLQKLVDYGGITVRGEDTPPIRGLKILLEDWKTLGPPESFTVRCGYPILKDKTTIMVSKPDDPICKMYRDQIVRQMKANIWQHPVFGDDVAIM